MDDKTFSQTLEEALGKHNLTLEKLAELSDIPLKYLNLIIKGYAEKLPPSPYVRGYIRHISETLEIPHNELWQKFQKESELRASGIKDKMPENRYAQKPVRKSLKLGLIIAVVVIIFLGSKINYLIGKSNLTITYPDTATLIFENSVIKIKGKINPTSKLLINNEIINFEEGGDWEKDVVLEPGLNSIEIKAQKFLGKELTITRTIIYTPKDEITGQEN